MYSKLAIGFTNLHVLWLLSRAADHSFFVRTQNQMYLIGMSIAKKRRKIRVCYRTQRAS